LIAILKKQTIGTSHLIIEHHGKDDATPVRAAKSGGKHSVNEPWSSIE
jgi:hypothetical protein